MAALTRGDLVLVNSQLHNLHGFFSVDAVAGQAVTIRHLDASGSKATIDKADIDHAYKAVYVKEESQ